MKFDKKQALAGLKEYVMTGAHAERSECESNSKKAKERLSSILIKKDEKRHEYNLAGHTIIAKYVREEVKETDNKGLITEILNYVRSEALSKVITLDKKAIEMDNLYDSVKEYKHTPTYYLKYTPNKFGKSFNYTTPLDYFGMSEDELISIAMFSKERKEVLNYYNKRVLEYFEEMEVKSLQTDVGTISKIENKSMWDINTIAQKLGDDFLRRYGTVKLGELDKWLDIGAIPRQVLSEYQQVIDIRLKFIVITEEAERRAMNAYMRMRDEKSLLRYA